MITAKPTPHPETQPGDDRLRLLILQPSKPQSDAPAPTDRVE